jgi:carbamate kinase
MSGMGGTRVRPEDLEGGPDLYRSDRETVLIALGGNALIQKGQKGTISEQEANADEVAACLMCLVEADYNLVVTHGNGPQVGNLLLQSDLTRGQVPPMPLDVLVAQTQGNIGYFLQQALLNRLRAKGIRRYVVTMITQVVVDQADPAFADPTKPIGLHYDEETAKDLAARLGWTMKPTAEGGWRRLVPSPKPLKVVQRYMVRHAAAEGNIVIAAGGGGIPIRIKEDGTYEGIEAVIDKDLTSAELALQVRADLLVILTGAPRIAVAFGTPAQRDLEVVTVAEAEALLAAGHFPAGSVGPKMAACVRFVAETRRDAIVCQAGQLREALAGNAGTRVVYR